MPLSACPKKSPLALSPTSVASPGPRAIGPAAGDEGDQGAQEASGSGGRVAGLRELCHRAQVPEVHQQGLEREILDAGAVHVDELTSEDWHGFSYWSQLRLFERRRILNNL